ncbi:hypothetical protein M9H77_23317 [Catharanthus roseus]|uniref:Uncharacterized protein n=1 Tax=Catharanthus roseus TaxID=4058 RepID=A0ACC0ATX9_CATRO|nr:hypothetical protein M9H77_23317 [Catharanthus roseus]
MTVEQVGPMPRMSHPQMPESRRNVNREASRPSLGNNGSRCELLAEEASEDDNLVEIQVLQDILGSIPGLTALVRPGPKLVHGDINVGPKLKTGQALKGKGPQKEQIKETAHRPPREVQETQIANDPQSKVVGYNQSRPKDPSQQLGSVQAKTMGKDFSELQSPSGSELFESRPPEGAQQHKRGEGAMNLDEASSRDANYQRETTAPSAHRPAKNIFKT